MKTLTAPKYLLDTNILIEAFLGAEPSASLTKKMIEEGSLAISAITVAEILSKASKAEEEKLSLLIDHFGTLPVNTTVAEIAGSYRKEFARKKTKIFLLDCLIAATAKLYNLKLITKNVKDYPMKDIEVIYPHI
jgi:predicted nucleic acid-binding protein